ncbi:MAG TPA: hypothetical protein VMN57_11975 [Anaerolineales bacterium]|nr:hypothetical protein [Anaerolineales bacterium]
MDDERMQILEMVSAGTISAEEAAQLIAALEISSAVSAETDRFDSADGSDPAEWSDWSDRSDYSAGSDPSDPEDIPEFKHWGAFWLVPLFAGVIMTVISGLLISTGIRADWNAFWMFCLSIPLLLGILVMTWGWTSRTARWLHVRVNTGQDEWPRRVAVSLPLPLRTSAWVMRYFGHYIPGLNDVPIPIHEAILALQESLNPDDPLYVKVDDAGGERVEVYIG